MNKRPTFFHWQRCFSDFLFFFSPKSYLKLGEQLIHKCGLYTSLYGISNFSVNIFCALLYHTLTARKLSLNSMASFSRWISSSCPFIAFSSLLFSWKPSKIKNRVNHKLRQKLILWESHFGDNKCWITFVFSLNSALTSLEISSSSTSLNKRPYSANISSKHTNKIGWRCHYRSCFSVILLMKSGKCHVDYQLNKLSLVYRNKEILRNNSLTALQ